MVGMKHTGLAILEERQTMSEFLENLKSRHAEAQKRFVAKQAQLNAMQQEFQAVAAEFNAWTTLLTLETRKEQSATIVLTPGTPIPAQTAKIAQLPGTARTNPTSQTNKTEIVRDLLRQHSSGMTPGEIWKAEEIKAEFSHRPYLYSVLKRLKDRGDITERRGKYFFKFSTKPEESKEENLTQ
jgi:type II secretory pathway pseudopilin PulG